MKADANEGMEIGSTDMFMTSEKQRVSKDRKKEERQLENNLVNNKECATKQEHVNAGASKHVRHDKNLSGWASEHKCSGNPDRLTSCRCASCQETPTPRKEAGVLSAVLGINIPCPT